MKSHRTTQTSGTRGTVTLVMGGVRSGKSRFAQSLAFQLGGDDVLFVATAQDRDHEMNRRIEMHRRDRPETWRTLEHPLGVGQAVLSEHNSESVILVDCLTLLVSNVICDDAFSDIETAEARVRDETSELIRVVESLKTHLLIVSGEVGCGIVPEHSMGRAFRDLLGIANQSIAAVADVAYLMVAGMALDVNKLSTSVVDAAVSLEHTIELEESR
jgi:adenosylcobinamide kinase/adenosylcobinamide-phosphate guanylyltransferase